MIPHWPCLSHEDLWRHSVAGTSYLWVVFFHRTQITRQLAISVQAHSPSIQIWWLQSEPCESSSLMAIPHECRLYIDMSDQMACHMPWLWRIPCLTFRNSWRRSSGVYPDDVYPYIMENGSKLFNNIVHSYIASLQWLESKKYESISDIAYMCRGLFSSRSAVTMTITRSLILVQNW